ncbi:hypothetical protein ACIPQA_33075 [Streptomyces sp. NPDC090109]|uniref:hypothetical protein n=1 Tax=Streptomyces sp. NPDC090109 TaxID=3365948 RepID=UPI00380EFF89
MPTTTTGPRFRTAGAVMLIGLAFLPGLLATLPLAFNGAQHTLGALGHATMPEGTTASLGWGLILLAAAALPFVAAPAALIVARARRVSRERTVSVCAKTVLICGVVSCLIAMVSAAV